MQKLLLELSFEEVLNLLGSSSIIVDLSKCIERKRTFYSGNSVNDSEREVDEAFRDLLKNVQQLVRKKSSLQVCLFDLVLIIFPIDCVY